MLKHRNRAFSLIEVMIAIGIIVVGLAGVTSALTFGMGASRHGDQIVQASNHARALMEAAIGRSYIDLAASVDGANMPDSGSGLNDAVADRVAINAAPFNLDPLPQSRIDGFTRNITVQRPAGAVAGQPEEHLAIMTITIYWFEKGVEKNVRISSIVAHTRDLP